MLGPLLHKNRNFVTPPRKETKIEAYLIEQCSKNAGPIRSLKAQFHDDRVFAGAVVMPSQTAFFKGKFAVELPRGQVCPANFERNHVGPAAPRLGNSLGYQHRCRFQAGGSRDAPRCSGRGIRRRSAIGIGSPQSSSRRSGIATMTREKGRVSSRSNEARDQGDGNASRSISRIRGRSRSTASFIWIAITGQLECGAGRLAPTWSRGGIRSGGVL